MKIVAFNSSPKKERGNTHVMVTEFLAGAAEKGADVQSHFLWGKHIEPCTACYSCWTRTPGVCIHNDDMPTLLDDFKNADLVVFATPLFVDNVTGVMKLFMDRLISYGDPHMVLDDHGEARHVKSTAKPTAFAAISNCGFPEQSQFAVLRTLFQRMARNFQCDLVAEIYRAAGGLLTSDLPPLRSAVITYRNLLRQAGREVVESGRILPETSAALEAPLVPMIADSSDYIRRVNALWDARLGRSES